MSAPTADRLVHDARIGPDDTPHEAATHLWAQVVASHGTAPGGPLGRLAVFDRVVLVLHDVLELSPSTVAEVLHTDGEAVDTALDTARARLGLPGPAADDCPAWDRERATHPVGDPAVLGAFADHAAACSTCRSTIDEDHRRRHRWWPRSAAGAAGAAGVAGAAAVGTAVGASALGGTLAAAAGIVATGVAVGALVGPMPEPPPPEPVVVDADPALPSDDEPLEGWPSEQAPASTSETDTGGQAAADVDDGAVDDDAGTGQGEVSGTADPDAPGTVADTVQDALDETVGDVTATVEESTDAVTDTVEETIDGVTDTLDDATGGATEDLGDTLDDTTSATGDALDETVDEVSDALQGTIDLLP